MTAQVVAKVAPLLLLSARVFLYALAVLIAFRLLNGGISTRGLLKDGEGGGVSALRLQMLMSTALAGASYVVAIHRQTTARLPPVDPNLLALVGGSNGLVLLKLAFSKLRNFLRINPQA